MHEKTVVVERVRGARPHRLGRHVASEEHPGFKSAALIARLVLGTVMLIAGIEKIGAIETFGHNIYNYEILPLELVNIAALLFVWAEIAVGVLLVAGAAVRGSALVSGVLLLVFIVAIGSAMARGLKIDCGCFVGKASAQSAAVSSSTVTPPAGAIAGAPAEPAEVPGTTKVGWPKLFEDIGLLGLAVFLVYYPRSHLAVDTMLRREDLGQPSFDNDDTDVRLS
jgi:uncharacterized membrane protein YphA (DoxX/SURF4 family)